MLTSPQTVFFFAHIASHTFVIMLVTVISEQARKEKFYVEYFILMKIQGTLQIHFKIEQSCLKRSVVYVVYQTASITVAQTL